MRENAGDLCRVDWPRVRRVSEPGGRLLVGLGAPRGSVAEAILARRTDVSLTVLISPAQQDEAVGADEIWVCARLGPIGFFALIRRISWRRFERVDQFTTGSISWLKYCVWPRPPWFCLTSDGAGDKPDA